ncbi:helix-turn-helix transcriptional regulator [Actinoplanes sp. NPDC051851]|uniref:AraC family transcriptional regulator n=1 Tax=Actinoplanes sp. NPDC051851 TaxID=3154753 RepID=UPI00343AB826
MSQTRHSHLAGETIARHHHDDHQLLYVSSGVLAARTDEAAWAAGPDRALWIPAGTWHHHRVYGRSTVHTLAFPAGEPLLDGRTPIVIAVSALLRELLMASTEPGLPTAEGRRLRAVIRDRVRRADVEPVMLPAARDPRLSHACRLVEEDLAVPRTMTWLSRRTGTSERTLARLFRDEYGRTYPQWRTDTRVFHAMIELARGATVTEAGHRCGWATTSAFVDTFARTTGQTPGAYRTAASPDRPTPDTRRSTSGQVEAPGGAVSG